MKLKIEQILAAFLVVNEKSVILARFEGIEYGLNIAKKFAEVYRDAYEDGKIYQNSLYKP